MKLKMAVVGAGSWGTAFALLLSRQGYQTSLWVREKNIYEELKTERTNSVFLPGFILPTLIKPAQELEKVLRGADVVFIAVPSRFCRQTYQNMAGYLRSGQVVVSLTKGIEEKSHMTMTEIMASLFPSSVNLAVLSGPSFAREVAAGLPTAVVVASTEASIAKTIQEALSSLVFRVYTSSDVRGVEIAGAVKNVIALAAGISDGLNFGHNARASLITRGLVEITRLGLKLGAKLETFYGLAGIGDLVLTCTSLLSRNYQVGFKLGQGLKLEEILAGMKMVAEGVSTSFSLAELARQNNVEMPICQEVYQVIYEKKDPRRSLADLMTRTLKEEANFLE